MFVQKVIKHGNSIAVVIPAQASEALGIKRGDLVVLQYPTEKVILLNFAVKLTWPNTIKKLYLKQHHAKRIK